MRSEVRKFTQHEIIEVLKNSSDQWIVTEIQGHTWFSDGKACIKCDGEKTEESLYFNQADQLNRVVAKLIAGLPAGYVRSVPGRLFGEFAKGYCRVFTAVPICDGTFAYLNEMYVRAVCLASEVWTHPADQSKHVCFVLEGQVVAVVMPLKDETFTGIKLEDLPEIPFLEDAALYYRASQGAQGMRTRRSEKRNERV